MGLLKRAVHRVKEGTYAVSMQSLWMKIGGQIPWIAIPISDTFKISCLIGRLHTKDVLENLGPIIPLISLVEYYPISAKDQSRIHQVGKKVLPGLFLGYALYAGVIWKGDIMIADIEELERMDASEIYSKRLNATEVIIPTQNGKYIFQSQMDESNSLEEIRNWEHPLWFGITQSEEKVQEIFLENQKGVHRHHIKTHIRIPLKQEMIIGPCQETSYTAITLNQESNFARREKNHSIFHWNALTSPELHIRTWMLGEKAASMIIGISMDQEICLLIGHVSHSLLY